MELSEFWESRLSAYAKGVVLEEHAEQHRSLAQLHPQSLNTVRVICGVCQNSNEPLIVAAELRIGRNESTVDNSNQGGLVCRVDLDSGIVESARTGVPLFDQFERHPDTGEPILGLQIPYWSETKQLVCATVCLYPDVSLLGVDVGISPEGPFLVETNHEPDKGTFEVARLPYRRTLMGMVKKGD